MTFINISKVYVKACNKFSLHINKTTIQTKYIINILVFIL